MAKLFGSQIDLQKIPVLGLVAESSTGEPSTPVNGQFWYDTTNQVMKVRDNGAWVLVGNAAGGSNPTGPAGGDLTGSTYPNPVIANNMITTAKILDSNVTTAKIADLNVTTGKIALLAVTDAQVATANKGGTAGTMSLRQLGFGSTQALAGTTELQQITAPTSVLSMNSQRIAALAPPSAGTDAANKDYVDQVAQGLDAKASVRAATTANITIATALNNADVLDGITLATNDRVLVKNQTLPQENGIYIVAASPSRATDMDNWAEVPGSFVFVEQGTANADTGWVVTADAGGTIGTTAMPWTQFSGAGQYTAGNGLTLTGIDFAVGGTTNRITVGADAVDIAATYVGQTSITTVGTITAGTWTGTDIAVADGGTGASTAAAARTNLGTVGKYAADVAALTAGVAATITHNLNTLDVHTQFRVNATGQDLILDWKVVTVNTITVTADIAYSANALRVVVIG